MFSNDIGVFSRDKDTDSESVSFDAASCIRRPENMQCKGCIVDRYMYIIKLRDGLNVVCQ